MKKRFRLLLLYFGFYDFVLSEFEIDTISNERITRITLTYDWKYGVLKIWFSTFPNKFTNMLNYHYCAAKEMGIKYTFAQLREMERHDNVFEFLLEAKYNGKKIQSTVGVN